jgi:hypothetical protein
MFSIAEVSGREWLGAKCSDKRKEGLFRNSRIFAPLMSAHDSLHMETLGIYEQLAQLGRQSVNMSRLDFAFITLLPTAGWDLRGAATCAWLATWPNLVQKRFS